MSIASESHEAFHRGTAPIFALLTREQLQRLTQLTADTTTISRLSTLADKASDGDLTPPEQAEYEAYIEANNLMAVLQAEARFRLAKVES